MSAIKVVIADDHQLFRNGIVSILQKDDTFEVIGEAADGAELLTFLEKKNVDVALVDLSMPGVSGHDVLAQAKQNFPQTRFIVLTMHDEGQYVVKSVRNGAHGYLLKNADENELKTAIKEVFAGRKYFNRHITELMINNMGVVENDSENELTPRELEVLKLVSEGKITKEIANQLSVSTRTIETHRVNMMKKLGVQNSAELIKKAAKMNLI
ncbi:MAG: response regulator [Flavobacteriales bacterium]